MDRNYLDLIGLGYRPLEEVLFEYVGMLRV